VLFWISPRTGFYASHALDAGPVANTPLTQVWSRHSVRGPSGPLAVDSLCIYVTGTDRRLTAVDLASGKNRWVVRLSGPGNAGVLRSPTLVYAATDQPGGPGPRNPSEPAEGRSGPRGRDTSTFLFA
jgi:PQQ enzyme repeat.